MFRRITTGILAAALFLAPLGALTLWSTSSAVAADESTSESENKLDQLIFLDGRTVKGEILEVNDSQIVMMVHYANFAPVKATYSRTEVLEIKRGAIAAVAPAQGANGVGGTANSAKDPNNPNADVDPDAAKLYVVEFEGLLGTAVSATPLRAMFQDVDETFDDLVEERLGPGRSHMIVDPEVRDKHIVVIKFNTGTDFRFGFDGLFSVEDLKPIFFEQMRDKGRRVVFWIERAVDGAAFFPWLSQEVYFTSDGIMGITDDLEDFSSGDDMVDEKQISLRLAAARGYAIEGGYGENGGMIIDAMARSTNWLIYRMEGGKPVLRMQKPTIQMLEEGWIILSDDGQNEFEDENSMRAFNDRLLLDDDIAYMLNLSKGTADTIEDLAYELRIQRNYAEVEHDGERIFEDWSDQVERAYALADTRAGSLWQELARIEVGGDYRERTRARGRQKNIYLQARSLFSRFAEVMDPQGQIRAMIDVRIEELEKQQQLDRAAQRGI